MISRNLGQLRKNINFNYSRLEAVFEKRNNEIEELIALCKKMRKYREEDFIKVEELLKKINESKEKSENRKDSFVFEASLEKELNDLISALFQRFPKLKTDSSFLRNRMKLSLQQIAIKKIITAHNEEVDLYNMRLKQFPDRLFAKRLKPYELV